jgi:tripartite-type tricarboxylate transporter receptor subunit TctC
MVVFGDRGPLAIFVASGLAPEFPTKAITVICPYGPGSGTDTCLRVLTESMNRIKVLPQPIVVENKPGGSATIGPATMAATTKSDGYTIGALLMGIFYQPHMMKTTWDPIKDFTYIIPDGIDATNKTFF